MTTFTDGYGGDVDTAVDTLLHSGNPTYNYGTSSIISLDEFAPYYKELMKFYLSAIPAGATCNSARLYMYHEELGSAMAFTVTVYSIALANAAWIEGTKNAALAGAGEPCWNALAADGAGGVTTAWAGSAGCSTSGTDYEASAIGSFSGDRGDAAGTEYYAELNTTRVAGWFGVSNTNYGIVFWNTANKVEYLCSSDHATTGWRPKLVVDYTAGATTLSVSVDGANSAYYKYGVKIKG
jgi:hypothetical protein